MNQTVAANLLSFISQVFFCNFLKLEDTKGLLLVPALTLSIVKKFFDSRSEPSAKVLFYTHALEEVA